MVEVIELVRTMKEEPSVMKVMQEILGGRIGEVKPVIDFNTRAGYSYPQVENLLGATTQEVTAILEFLAEEGVLEKHFHDKLLTCPHCQSPNLRPSLRCSKCGSGNIAKGRILEHFACSNVGLEEDYIAVGKYMCPKCKKELRFLGTDYRSLGVNFKCHNCGEIFSEAMLKWNCLKCSLLFGEGEAREIVLYSYRLNDEKKSLLEFELGPKARFIDLLRSGGYEVTEGVRLNGTSKSGAEHLIDILARRDDGLVTYTVGIGIIVDRQGREIVLDRVFAFDDKAYDLGIRDRVLLVLPRLNYEARRFAERQRIKVFDSKELENLMLGEASPVRKRGSGKSFQFQTMSRLLEYLKGLGYEVEENARRQGRSGAVHTMGIVARDSGIVDHTLGIDTVVSGDEVDLDAVALFDTRAYDLCIHDKVLLVSPGLTRDARLFAQYQGIKIIDVDDPAKLT